LSIYNKTEKSSKSSDAVNIFEVAFFSRNLRQKGKNLSFASVRFYNGQKVSQNGE
jgi:hypothetical protein